MGSHQVVTHHPAQARAVDGHQPIVVFNVSTGHAGMQCATCGWMAQRRAQRWHDRVEPDWRVHAGDIAMGVDLTHGRAGTNCRCYRCFCADRDAVEGGRHG